MEFIIVIALIAGIFWWRKRLTAENRNSSIVSKSSFSETTATTAYPDVAAPIKTEKAYADSIAKTVKPTRYRFIAIDVETANSDPASICQIGLAFVSDDGSIETLSQYVNPDDDFASFNINLHGIDHETVADAPDFDDVIQAMRPVLEANTLVQHSSFDRTAITAACENYMLPPIRSKWVDSVRVAQRAWPELKGNGGHGLANLKEILGLDFTHHDAAEDAKAAAQVVLLAEQKLGIDFSLITNNRNSTGQAYEKSVAIEGNSNGPLFGHSCCFTGQLSLSRAEAATLAASAGITVKSSVSKKVTLLVVGDQDLSLLNGHNKSTKHRRAEELIAEGHQMRVIGETEFRNLIRQT